MIHQYTDDTRYWRALAEVSRTRENWRRTRRNTPEWKARRAHYGEQAEAFNEEVQERLAWLHEQVGRRVLGKGPSLTDQTVVSMIEALSQCRLIRHWLMEDEMWQFPKGSQPASFKPRSR